MKPNRTISDKRQRECELGLSEAFAVLTNPRDVHALLQDICTPAELQALADRWQVVLLLEQGLPYRTIPDRTGVSVTTIGRVARYLGNGAGGYQAALEPLPH